MKLARLFLYSVTVILLATAAEKIICSFGHGRILLERDPVTALQFRNLFRLVSVVEGVIALACCLRERIWLATSLVAWLATGFLIYGIVLLWGDYRKPCPCLGNLTDMLHISFQGADTAMKIILGYLLLGSYATLFWLWKEKGKSSLPASTSAEPAKSVA